MIEVNAKAADAACEVAEDFTRLYYRQMDNARHLTSKLYLDTGVLSWNGNGITGSEKIQTFIMRLPSTTHVVKSLDAHPVTASQVADRLTYIIQACGDVTYQTEEKRKQFQQTFVIVAVDGKWKIASDCFRLQVPI